MCVHLITPLQSGVNILIEFEFEFANVSAAHKRLTWHLPCPCPAHRQVPDPGAAAVGPRGPGGLGRPRGQHRGHLPGAAAALTTPGRLPDVSRRDREGGLVTGGWVWSKIAVGIW